MMIDRQTEKQIMALVFWFMAISILLAMLTSCGDPYASLANTATVSTETPARTTTPKPTQIRISATLAPRTCTVQTGVPRGYLNLRTGAGVRYAVIRILVEGEKLEVLERAAWLQVIDPEGTRGYVNSRYCR